MTKEKLYCIGTVCKTLTTWSILFEISRDALRNRLAKNPDLIKAICQKNNGAKHNLTNSKEYKAWRSMKHRCLNSNNKHFEHYGGRGITVCNEWLHSFETFYNDLGPAPHKYSLDRINNDGNYEPSNCRWADQKTQQNNKRPPKYNNNNLLKEHHIRCRYENKYQVRIISKILGTYIKTFNTLEEAIVARDNFLKEK